ncbi:hypothetical protein KHU50_005180 [Colletotrichum sp. SAR 10_65]|nr:hypothetical protein KHU50_005180 [Colletotrichum sp. SAR 10_65]KAI8178203.1 hypothetical protein K4K51_004812 [Colletotrichum sp. SAR 10_75]
MHGLISKAVHLGLLNFHREIDSANADKYAKMNPLCDDPDDHPIRGWYNGSEKVKARILDLKEDTHDQRIGTMNDGIQCVRMACNPAYEEEDGDSDFDQVETDYEDLWARGECRSGRL